MGVIIGPNDKRTRVEITLPVTMEGEVAFDENGKQVGGREPVRFVLPRFEFVARPRVREIMKRDEEIRARKEFKDDRNLVDLQCELIISSMLPFIDDDRVVGLLQNLTLGELKQIQADWNEGSEIPLDRSSDSAVSSKSTKARSDTT
ncbi:MAG: hypothetical protein K0U84_18385 [Actinomycetia bacterium]|nr:hypothetical protein [Actinomycetes bacterium]